MRSKVNALISGAIILITLLVFFAFVREKQTVDYISLIFILIAEGLIVYVTAFSKRISDMHSISAAAVGGLYLFVCIVFSLLFGRALKEHLSGYAAAHIIMLIIAICIYAVMTRESLTNKTQNDTYQNRLALMRQCEMLAEEIYESSAPMYKDGARKVFEEIKYTDKTSCYNGEKILGVLNELRVAHNGEPEKIEALNKKVCDLVHERRANMAQSKHGSF